MLIPGLVGNGRCIFKLPQSLNKRLLLIWFSWVSRVRHNESLLHYLLSKLIVFFYQRCQFNGGQVSLFNNLSTVDCNQRHQPDKISAATKSWCSRELGAVNVSTMKSADMPGQDSQYHLDLRL